MIAAEKACQDETPGGSAITVSRMAGLLEVSPSGYYAWAARREAPPGHRAARRADLMVKIKTAHTASRGVYGAPRILADLRAGGEVVSPKTVTKLMRRNNIRGISPVPAGSGMTSGKHRINHGGHRQLNAAIYRTVIVRMRFHEPTIAYIARRTVEIAS